MLPRFRFLELQCFGALERNRDEATFKAKIRRIHRVSAMAGVNEKFKGGENLCMLSAMYNAMDKKQQDVITVSFIAFYCRRRQIVFFR